MTKLSYTLGMKVFACFIAVLSGITAFFDGIGIFLANSYDFYSSSLAELKLAHPYLDTGMLTKLYGMRGSLLPILVISLLLFAISVIYLLCAAGHRPDTDEIVPNLQDKIPLDLYFAIVCPILLAILFLILEGRNPLADTGALSFVVIGSIILAILGLATLLTCVTRLKLGRYFYQHTIAYQVIRFCWKMLAAVCSTIADAVKSISTTWKIAVAWLVISAFYGRLWGDCAQLCTSAGILLHGITDAGAEKRRRGAGKGQPELQNQHTADVPPLSRAWKKPEQHFQGLFHRIRAENEKRAPENRTHHKCFP